MRLTRLLAYYVTRTRVPGQLYGGKTRKLRRVTEEIKYAAVRDMIEEQKNLEVLQNPYLTEEQDFQHIKALGKNAKNFEQMVHERNLEKMEKRWPNKTTKNHFAHLNNTKSWD